MKVHYLVLLSYFFLITACQQERPEFIQDVKKDFFEANGLDKRTTLLQVERNGKSITGRAESDALAKNFVAFYNKQHSKNLENKITVLQPKIAYVHNSVSNARSEGRHSAELATQYLMGQTLKIWDEQNGWFYIQGPDDYLGWMDAGGLIMNNEASEQWKKAKKITVEANNSQAYLASDPNQTATDLVFGNKLGELNNGHYITPSGLEVIVKDKSIFEAPTEKDSIQLVLNKAYSLLGRPYLWGGTSTKAVDCSGFTRTSFMNAGLMLGRDASLQVHEGKEVNKDDQAQWLPGDLCFFGNLREDGSERITHVAIHTGNGQIIHSSQWVKVESLNPSDALFNRQRLSTLLHVKRIIGQ